MNRFLKNSSQWKNHKAFAYNTTKKRAAHGGVVATLNLPKRDGRFSCVQFSAPRYPLHLSLYRSRDFWLNVHIYFSTFCLSIKWLCIFHAINLVHRKTTAFSFHFYVHSGVIFYNSEFHCLCTKTVEKQFSSRDTKHIYRHTHTHTQMLTIFGYIFFPTWNPLPKPLLQFQMK